MGNPGLKILLIDDTAIVLQRMQAIIAELSNVSQTEAVLSAEAGLQLMENYEPDVMLLDINMPGMNGIELLKKLNRSGEGRPVIIMLTNNSYAGYKDECLRLGADFFLDKSRDFLMIPSIIEMVSSQKPAISC